MDARWMDDLLQALRNHGVGLAPGLTDAEIRAAEERYRFQFPPDLRELLQTVLPLYRRFPNWREGPEESLRKQLRWPLEGIRFDVEHNNFWMEAWGSRPSNLADAFAIAESAVANAPVLIPLYGHRYLPGEPEAAGNPVFSVWQTDIIYYGDDLASYFHNEFHAPLPSWSAAAPRPIRFWGELVS
jgi:hypothetical protein